MSERGWYKRLRIFYWLCVESIQGLLKKKYVGGVREQRAKAKIS